MRNKERFALHTSLLHMAFFIHFQYGILHFLPSSTTSVYESHKETRQICVEEKKNKKNKETKIEKKNLSLYKDTDFCN